ncbi:hypothetical protein D7294_16060 [Streptomyces hoynatensis]|uniref:Lipoprotein n=2 Tax=Streptomyces hoynatensis TaxID=1141874 RepID=A0A3A9YZF0_9ACTN|nr:hypothetical protein D7294_16060 [Streptomyces hoynatensis]
MVAVAAAGLLALTACGSDDDSSSQGADGQKNSEGATGSGGASGEGEDAAAGDSLASLPPEEIADRAQHALQSATSVRMRTLGDPAVTGMGLDLHMDQEGSCAGSVTQGGAGTVELLVRADDEVWMKPDTQFWQSQLAVANPSVLNLLDGVYLYGHTSDPEMSQLAGVCSLAAMQEDMGSDDGSGAPDEVGPETEYNGVPVVTLSGPDDEGNPVTMLIATEGEPYPLLVRTTEGGTETEIELSQYNEPVEFQEPPADQILNVADFRTGNITA